MRIAALLVSALLLSSCATTQKSIPSNITLKEALSQVKSGIEDLGKPTEGKKAGLMVSEVSVTFNVSGKETESNELMVDLLPGNVLKEIPSGSFGSSATYEQTRGNQITFKFQSVLFANKDSVIGLVSSPSTLMSETTTTEDKGKIVTVTKKPEIKQPIALQALLDMLENRYIVANNPALEVQTVEQAPQKKPTEL